MLPTVECSSNAVIVACLSEDRRALSRSAADPKNFRKFMLADLAKREKLVKRSGAKADGKAVQSEQAWHHSAPGPFCYYARDVLSVESILGGAGLIETRDHREPGLCASEALLLAPVEVRYDRRQWVPILVRGTRERITFRDQMAAILFEPIEVRHLSRQYRPVDVFRAVGFGERVRPRSRRLQPTHYALGLRGMGSARRLRDGFGGNFGHHHRFRHHHRRFRGSGRLR